MPSAGQILHHKNFVFQDGNTGNKYLIVLNTCDNDKTCLVLKTTSQPKRYPYATPGCNSCQGIFCIYQECEQDFTKDTYVQLDYVYPINVEDKLDMHQVSFTGHLTPQCFTGLKRCLRNFREDIPQKYWAVIYSQKQQG